MNDSEDLDRISSELVIAVQSFIRSQELKNVIVGGNQVKKDAELLYIELRERYGLSFEECEKVDRLFAKKMIFNVDLRKLRKDLARLKRKCDMEVSRKCL